MYISSGNGKAGSYTCVGCHNNLRYSSSDRKIQMTDNSEFTFRSIFYDVKTRGIKVSPRGQLVLEIENYSCAFKPFVRFQSFKCRKLNLDYVRDEFLWYLKGDRHDLSIAEKAKMWRGMIENNAINSNYGQYIFGKINQFDNVVKLLKEDKYSRRASITILDSYHLLFSKNDIPCTYAINFRIRNSVLNMTVQMRSQDAVYGLGNDCPTFSFIHEMMLNTLKGYYPELQYGEYFHFVNSFHVYERHFKMLESIVTNNDTYEKVLCPQISGPDEVDFMRKLDFSNIPEDYKFCRWLLVRDNAKKNNTTS